MFATERYALPILRPLAETLQAAGHGVSALLVRGAAGSALPAPVHAVDVRGAVALTLGTIAPPAALLATIELGPGKDAACGGRYAR